ncbi:rihA [Symbiodinium sp. CCMP2592]|nr:rihA [Symbiodinium sp. CCMP2592]
MALMIPTVVTNLMVMGPFILWDHASEVQDFDQSASNWAPFRENWKLVLKAGKTSKLGFSSPLWTNSDLLNKDSAEDKAEDAKYDAFNTVPFKKIRMCVDEPKENCVEHEFKKEYDNAKALFSGKYIKDTKVDKKGILKAFKVKKGTYQDCPMQRPGFNIECNGGNKARWGYCNNCATQACQNNDNDDADGAIGIGIAGQSTNGELGAGWTAYFASPGGQCTANGKTHKAVPWHRAAFGTLGRAG